MKIKEIKALPIAYKLYLDSSFYRTEAVYVERETNRKIAYYRSSLVEDAERLGGYEEEELEPEKSMKSSRSYRFFASPEILKAYVLKQIQSQRNHLDDLEQGFLSRNGF